MKDLSDTENVVEMSEDSRSLEVLLTWAHPSLVRSCKVQNAESLPEVITLLTLLEKYQFFGSVPRLVEELLSSSPLRSGYVESRNEENALLAFRV